MVLNFAHRGSLTEAPENTLSAFNKAISHQTKAIELDVQLTKDGHLVVIHDQKLTRFNANYTGFINDYTLSEVKQIDIGSSFSSDFAGETIASLEEVLSICPDDLVLNIEIKNIPIIHDGIAKKLIDSLKKHNRLHNIMISSFDHLALKEVQTLSPDIPIGLLLYYPIIKPWEYAKYCGLTLTSAHPHVAYTNKQLIDEFHQLGMKVYPYTVNEIEKYNKLIKLGVDGVFSNTPEIFSTTT